LNPLDQFIKRDLKCPAFLRYVDDFLLFANDKQTLQQWRTEIINFLATLRLTLHVDRAQPRLVTTGIPFLGFVIYPDYRRVKRRKVVAYRRRLKKLYQAYKQEQIGQAEVVASLRGWLAHIRFGDTWAMAEQMLQPITFLKER
jgi:hypothetical protein